MSGPVMNAIGGGDDGALEAMTAEASS